MNVFHSCCVSVNGEVCWFQWCIITVTGFEMREAQNPDCFCSCCLGEVHDDAADVLQGDAVLLCNGCPCG